MSHMRDSHQFSNNWKVRQHWRKRRRHLLLADAVTWLPVQVNCSTSELLNFMIDFKMHGCAEYQMVNTHSGCALSVKEEFQLIFKVCLGVAHQLVIYIICLYRWPYSHQCVHRIFCLFAIHLHGDKLKAVSIFFAWITLFSIAVTFNFLLCRQAAFRFSYQRLDLPVWANDWPLLG